MSDISGIEPGTVLDAEELDLSRPEQYFQVQEINEEIRGEISGKSYTETRYIPGGFAVSEGSPL